MIFMDMPPDAVALEPSDLVPKIKELLSGPLKKREVTVEDFLRHLRKLGPEPVRSLLVRALKMLEDEGGGKFISGRRGKKSRFQPSPALANALEAREDSRVGTEASSVGRTRTASADQAPFVTHQFALREELVVTLQLPSNLTERESERLAGFIRTLPFGE
jgi:hypothetical protein